MVCVVQLPRLSQITFGGAPNKTLTLTKISIFCNNNVPMITRILLNYCIWFLRKAKQQYMMRIRIDVGKALY